MSIETPNIRIVVLPKTREAVVLLKRELYLSDIILDVRTELININFSGAVFFDMMLIKGVPEHYYHMEFQNMTFDYSTNSILSNPAANIMKESKKFYRLHPNILSRTSLTPRQKERAIIWIEG